MRDFGCLKQAGNALVYGVPDSAAAQVIADIYTRLLSELAAVSKVREASIAETQMYKEVHADLRSTATSKFASAVEFGEKSTKAKGRLLVVCGDEQAMYSLHSNLKFYAAPDVLLFPAWDCLPYDRSSPSAVQVSRRVGTLSRLSRLQADDSVIVLTTVNAALQRVPPKAEAAKWQLPLKKGEEIGFGLLTEFLVKSSYNRTGKVLEVGEFAVRGGILDIFPAAYEKPLRLDFFGDFIESIRTFDPLSQITDTEINEAVILPMSEVDLSEGAITSFRENYRDIFGGAAREDPLYESISSGRKFPGFEHWLPLFYGRMETIFDYMPGARIITPEWLPKAMEERDEQVKEFYDNRVNISGKTIKALKEAIYRPLAPDRLYLGQDEFESRISGSRIAFSQFAASPEQLKIDAAVMDAGYRSGIGFTLERSAGLFDALKEHIRMQQGRNLNVIISCSSNGSRERVMKMLLEHKIACEKIESFKSVCAHPVSTVTLAVLPLERGFTGGDYCIITEQDIFGERLVRYRPKKRKTEDFFLEAANFNEGELVVHRDHGIGRFDGLINIVAGDAPHDCLRIIYEGGDKLFVPVENIEVITSFGQEGDGVKLDKLGAASWQARKAKVKERITIAAAELIKMAAERELRQAPVMNPAEGLFDEFCARFPYSETEDQERAIEEVLGDLSSGVPSERLVCGDVGFGKTEVALRAAFAAVAVN